MRELGIIKHPTYRISVLKIEDQFILQFQNAKCDFSIKLSADEVDAESLLNLNLQKLIVDEIFQKLFFLKLEILSELKTKKIDEFDKII